MRRDKTEKLLLRSYDEASENECELHRLVHQRVYEETMRSPLKSYILNNDGSPIATYTPSRKHTVRREVRCDRSETSWVWRSDGPRGRIPGDVLYPYCMKNTFNVYLKICELGDKCLIFEAQEKKNLYKTSRRVQKIKVFTQAFSSLGLWEITTTTLFQFLELKSVKRVFVFVFCFFHTVDFYTFIVCTLTNSCLIMSEKKLKFRFEPIKHLYRFRKIDSKSSIVSHVSNVSRSEAECKQKRKYWERVAAN